MRLVRCPNDQLLHIIIDLKMGREDFRIAPTHCDAWRGDFRYTNGYFKDSVAATHLDVPTCMVCVVKVLE